MRWAVRLASRISVRLLAFNLLLVFLPVAGVYYLDVYERQLRDAQERAMVQQGRVLAAALSERGALRPVDAEDLLLRLRQQSEARMRIVEADGRVLADSSLLGPRLEEDAGVPGRDTREPGLRDDPRYRLGAWLYRQYERGFGVASTAADPDPAEADTRPDGLRTPEIREAYRPGQGKTEQGHTGLGLALVTAIVEGYGGVVSAVTRPEGGACVTVRLPLA